MRFHSMMTFAALAAIPVWCATWTSVSASAEMAVETAAVAGELPCGSAGAGPCDVPHGGFGCTWNACCNEVCTLDPSCCDTGWTEFCVKLGAELCKEIPCPREGSCTEAHDGFGCDDEACCFFVCRFDPYCCFGRWDAWCATEAIQLCEAPQCSLFMPPGARVEAEECGERTNDGCNLPSMLFDTITCGETIFGSVFTSSPRDSDWYTLELDSPTSLTIDFSPEFPGEVMIVEGPCLATRVHDLRSGFGCVKSTLQIDLGAGSWWIVVSVATEVRSVHRAMPCEDPKDPESPLPAFNRHYLLTLSCGTGGILGDLNGDGIVDGADLGLLLQSWGPCVGCAADLNGDGEVNGADLGLLLQNWST